MHTYVSPDFPGFENVLQSRVSELVLLPQRLTNFKVS